MVKKTSAYKSAATLIIIIIGLTMVAGCIGNVSVNTSTLNGSEDSLVNTTIDVPSNQVVASPVTPISGSLCLDEIYDYTDATRNNKMSVTVKKYSGEFIDSIEYHDAALDKRIIITPESGKKYYLIFMQYRHTGIVDLNKNHNMTTPNLAFHRLIDAEGNEYRPISLNSEYTYSLYGTNYVPTVLNRWDGEMEYEGYLLFEVPEKMTLNGAYLKINLGKWGSPMWRLWE